MQDSALPMAPTQDRCQYHGVWRFDITLIRPTNYTDDGYPVTTRIGVIRSNTLTQMATLTRDLANYPFFNGAHFNVRLIDEAIQRVPRREIIACSKAPGVASIIMLVGVQSNQYPRAQDIAAWFLPHGIPVLIGGFHVSGTLSMVGLTHDLREALVKGITLVAGEVEGKRLPTIVADVVRGQTQPLYNFLNPTTDLSDLPIPHLTRDDLKGFASPFSTMDTGRGCVFTCDFCTIINVQGRTMRYRNPQQVVEFVRQNYHQAGVEHCFFTDDNLARNPLWRELFAGLIQLREHESIPFTFMMQADLAARKMKGGDFFELAARAGCNQVFFGVESVNRENLRSQGKFQNQVGEYQGLVAHCHSLGITCHAGYILGLPFDTPASIEQDVAELRRMGFDSASFYNMIPLPGSKDHQTWHRAGRWMHPDFNVYDSAHVAVKPERMTSEELMQAWRDAWVQFYSTKHMIEARKLWRNNPKEYWGRMFFDAWYLYAPRVEKLHPMNCGFWTIRHRDDRRPGFPKEAFLPFWWGRCVATGHKLRGIAKLFFQLQEVWLRSRPKSKVEEALQEIILQTRQGMIDSKTHAIDWRDLKAGELRTLYQKLHIQMPEVKVPSAVNIWLRKRNPFISSYTRAYVQRIWRHWYRHIWNPFTWIEVWLFEWVNGIRFLYHFRTEGR